MSLLHHAAYGMVMWEITTGQVTFNEVDEEGVLIAGVRNGDREEIPPETPNQYANLIRRCWSQRREERPAAVEVLTELNSMATHSI